MTSTSDSRILEGLKHIDKAEKYVKRSLFKWSADNDSAADEFNKAAISFQNAQAYEECKNAYIKAADCYLKINSQSAAARCYEHMAMIHKEIKEWNECYQAICKASDLFQQEGTTTTAILCLNKGGKMLERSPLPEKSADLYIKALEIVGSEEDSNQFSQLCAKVAQIYVRLNRYFDAVFYLTKQLDSDLKSNNFNEVGRCCLNLVLVQLTRGDSVSAENAMNQACSSLEFSGSAFCEVCLKLIRSYEENDGQGLKLLQTQNNTIKNLDTEYLILARNLKTPFEMEGSRGEDDNPSGGKRENSDDDLEKDTIDEERRRQELSKLNFAEQLQKRLSLHQNELPARKDSKGKRASASNERDALFASPKKSSAKSKNSSSNANSSTQSSDSSKNQTFSSSSVHSPYDMSSCSIRSPSSSAKSPNDISSSSVKSPNNASRDKSNYEERDANSPHIFTPSPFTRKRKESFTTEGESIIEVEPEDAKNVEEILTTNESKNQKSPIPAVTPVTPNLDLVITDVTDKDKEDIDLR